jgi:hypothetical protein
MDAGNKTPANFHFWRAVRGTEGSGDSSNATPAARRHTGVAAQREKGQALDGRNLHDTGNKPFQRGSVKIASRQNRGDPPPGFLCIVN